MNGRRAVNLKLAVVTYFQALIVSSGYGQAPVASGKQLKPTAIPESQAPLICYFPPTCYRPADPTQLPLSAKHSKLEGRVFVQFIVDSTLAIHHMTVMCTRLRWKQTGKSYAADCQGLTSLQRREVEKLTFYLVRQVKMMRDPSAPRSRCRSEMWTVPVVFR